MFLPPPFAEPDRRAAVELSRAVGFGHLVVAGEVGIASSPMPFLIDDDGERVRGHLARPNPVLRLLPADALLIVPVDDAYISPSWYPSKREHGRVVPTWNYQVVHVHGRLESRDGDWTEQLVRDLTDHHEAATAEPWSVDDAPADHIAGLLRAIVGVELAVTEIVAKRKLGQNRPAADIAGAAAGLESRRNRVDVAVAAAMRRHAPERGG